MPDPFSLVRDLTLRLLSGGSVRTNGQGRVQDIFDTVQPPRCFWQRLNWAIRPRKQPAKR